MKAAGPRQILRLGWFWSALLVIALIILPHLLSRFSILLLTEVIIMALFATSFNLIFGYGGMVSFGHAAFYGTGAYTVALLLKRYEMPLLVGLFAAPLVSALIAFVIGWFCVRTIRLYFALLTLAFAQLLYIIVFQWYGFTGGSDGIHGIPRPEALLGLISFYYFALAIVLLSIVALWFIVNSPFGWSLRGIRENTGRVQFLGINDRFYKLVGFTIAGGFAGVAGALFTLFQRFATPDFLHWTTSADPVLMSILGGMFNFIGPSVGAVIFILLRQFISEYTLYWQLVLGAVLLTLVLVIPEGVVGFIQEKLLAKAKPAQV